MPLISPFKKKKNHPNIKPREGLVFPLLFLGGGLGDFTWFGGSLAHIQVDTCSRLKVGIELFAFFSPPLHTVAVNSQKFGDFYGLNRTAFSEYIGSWILYLACNWELQVLNPLRGLQHYYYFSRFLFHLPIVRTLCCSEPLMKPWRCLCCVSPLKNWQ